MKNIISSNNIEKRTKHFTNEILKSNNESLIINDPDGVYYKKTALELKEKGYEVLILDAAKKEVVVGKSVGYSAIDYKCFMEETEYLAQNRLYNVPTSNYVTEIADLMIINTLYSKEVLSNQKINSEQIFGVHINLLKSVLLLVCDLDKPDNNITRALSLIKENDYDTLVMLMEEGTLIARDQFAYYTSSVRRDNDFKFAKINKQLFDSIQPFTSNEFKELEVSEPFSMIDLKKQKTVLYVVYPREKTHIYMPILSLMFYQILEFLKRNSQDLPVKLLLDNFYLLGRIHNIELLIPYINNANILVGMNYLQDIKLVYGENRFEIVKNLF